MSTAEVTAPAALPNSLARAAVHSFVHTTGAWVASQLEACTRCEICAQACHFYEATGNPEFAPVWKVELLRRAYEQRFTVGGKLKLALGIEKRISDADIEHWSTIVYQACTLCNKCAMVCPMGIQLGPLIHDVREAMAEAGVVPADLLAAVRKQEELGSPLGVTDDAWADRIEWIADEWEVEIPIDVTGAETLVAFTSIELMKFPENP
ncbi:MAG: (Fe-S)-binding protein [Chloroflexales bacterium]|nr:(Fe-S)-binding protein [Chloroflexales bacterium]